MRLVTGCRHSRPTASFPRATRFYSAKEWRSPLISLRTKAPLRVCTNFAKSRRNKGAGEVGTRRAAEDEDAEGEYDEYGAQREGGHDSEDDGYEAEAEQPAAVAQPSERVIDEDVPERASYHQELHAAAARADVDACEQILTDMEDNGLPPGARAYHALVFAYVKAADVDTALAVVKQEYQMGIQPLTETYVVLVYGFVEANDVARATAVVQSMTRAGKDTRLGWLTLVKGLFRNNQPGDAIRQLYKGLDDGLRPDASLYEDWIAAYCDCDLVEEAVDLVREMKQQGLAPARRHMDLIARAAPRYFGLLPAEHWVVGTYTGVALMDPDASAYEALLEGALMPQDDAPKGAEYCDELLTALLERESKLDPIEAALEANRPPEAEEPDDEDEDFWEGREAPYDEHDEDGLDDDELRLARVELDEDMGVLGEATTVVTRMENRGYAPSLRVLALALDVAMRDDEQPRMLDEMRTIMARLVMRPDGRGGQWTTAFPDDLLARLLWTYARNMRPGDIIRTLEAVQSVGRKLSPLVLAPVRDEDIHEEDCVELAASDDDNAEYRIDGEDETQESDDAWEALVEPVEVDEEGNIILGAFVDGDDIDVNDEDETFDAALDLDYEGELLDDVEAADLEAAQEDEALDEAEEADEAAAAPSWLTLWLAKAMTGATYPPLQRPKVLVGPVHEVQVQLPAGASSAAALRSSVILLGDGAATNGSTLEARPGGATADAGNGSVTTVNVRVDDWLRVVDELDRPVHPMQLKGHELKVELELRGESLDGPMELLQSRVWLLRRLEEVPQVRWKRWWERDEYLAVLRACADMAWLNSTPEAFDEFGEASMAEALTLQLQTEAVDPEMAQMRQMHAIMSARDAGMDQMLERQRAVMAEYEGRGEGVDDDEDDDDDEDADLSRRAGARVRSEDEDESDEEAPRLPPPVIDFSKVSDEAAQVARASGVMMALARQDQLEEMREQAERQAAFEKRRERLERERKMGLRPDDDEDRVNEPQLKYLARKQRQGRVEEVLEYAESLVDDYTSYRTRELLALKERVRFLADYRAELMAGEGPDGGLDEGPRAPREAPPLQWQSKFMRELDPLEEDESLYEYKDAIREEFIARVAAKTFKVDQVPALHVPPLDLEALVHFLDMSAESLHVFEGQPALDRAMEKPLDWQRAAAALQVERETIDPRDDVAVSNAVRILRLAQACSLVVPDADLACALAGARAEALPEVEDELNEIHDTQQNGPQPDPEESKELALL